MTNHYIVSVKIFAALRRAYSMHDTYQATSNPNPKTLQDMATVIEHTRNALHDSYKNFTIEERDEFTKTELPLLVDQLKKLIHDRR